MEPVIKYGIGKIFRDNTQHITSVSFSNDGERLVTTSADETLNVYDVLEPKHLNTIPSKKYGASLARFIDQTQIVYGSTKGDDTIRLLDVTTCSFVRYFRGHEKRVTCLEAAPTSTALISCAMNDKEGLKIWDTRSTTCQATMPGIDFAVFSPDGITFLAATQPKLLFYDLRAYDRGPTNSYDIKDSNQSKATWCDARYSPDGSRLIINTIEGELLQFMTKNLNPLFPLVGRPANNTGHGLEACWLGSEARTVLAGGSDGRIYSWDVGKSSVEVVLEGHPAYVMACRANPRYESFVTACTNLVNHLFLRRFGFQVKRLNKMFGFWHSGV